LSSVIKERGPCRGTRNSIIETPQFIAKILQYLGGWMVQNGDAKESGTRLREGRPDNIWLHWQGQKKDLKSCNKGFTSCELLFFLRFLLRQALLIKRLVGVATDCDRRAKKGKDLLSHLEKKKKSRCNSTAPCKGDQ